MRFSFFCSAFMVKPRCVFAVSGSVGGVAPDRKIVDFAFCATGANLKLERGGGEQDGTQAIRAALVSGAAPPRICQPAQFTL
jgi:hypothetical protein